ncbi:hypothetical protein ACF090_08325 [Streptomyces sp. NPDC014892]|uniref:hypothetical protein n=1 Tax=Streptomyces sp. NPDC014892 TaxID=3364930 RepID=UPI0036FCA808
MPRPATVAAALVDQWEDKHAIEVSGREVTIRFPHLEDVRALLPFGSAITVHGRAEARAHLRALAGDLARHYA